MKKLRFLLTATLAVAILAITVTSCDLKSKLRDALDDDERTEKSERLSEDEEETPAEAYGNTVDSFCEDLNELAAKVNECTSLEELETIEDMEAATLGKYRNDGTVLTTSDKEAITNSLTTYGGASLQRYVDLSGEYVSEEDQFQMGYTVGLELAKIAQDATTLGDVVYGMDNFGE